ncbi:hypothetical protein FUAX_22050 [Fulvitalea axinellae]|uniref:RagB/SusD family nutrient uptake outer membrane protein n=1 Tax=Fulvitalea axinellae TaxID=1182444 RepID=A0AAU9D1H8_9BACT|nr:hypothetical protein FUAX_22050 [Fulvitalea axinellae]
MKLRRYMMSALMAGALFSTGCDGYLDYEPNNDKQLEEDILVSEENLVKILNGAYSNLAGGEFLGGRTQHLSELLADNVNGSALIEGERGVYTRNTDIFDGFKNDAYTKGYKAIRNANLVLENLDLVGLPGNPENPESVEEINKRKIAFEAEARFIRAIAHFELVRLWGKPYVASSADADLGIPYRLSSDPTIAPVRETVAQVYSNVLADLKFAEALSDNNDRQGQTRWADKWAAKGYQAKVYFQMNDFENALKYADDVLKNSGATFDERPDYILHRFDEKAVSEEIFGIVSLGTNNDNGGELRGKYYFDEKVITHYPMAEGLAKVAVDKTDRRMLSYDNGETNEGILALAKFKSIKYDIDGDGTLESELKKTYMQVPLLHYTQLLLTKAESAAELGQLDVAGTALTKVLDRAYTSGKIAPITKKALIDEIRLQRRLELVGEGDRIHQIKRIGAKGEASFARGASWNCPGLSIQFPKSEIDSNRGNFRANEEGGCN